MYKLDSDPYSIRSQTNCFCKLKVYNYNKKNLNKKYSLIIVICLWTGFDWL